jgi:asparagine synthetase B (glutamine-hydrolysing)
MDSDFVLRCFHRNDIKIHPIIVSCCNESENEYAYRLCDELKITPTIIKINEEEFLKYYEEYIYKKFNSVGYNSTQMIIAAKAVEELQGCLVTGNHFIGDGDDMITDEIYLISREWDCYSFSIPNTIDFFLYTPEIVYALMPKEYVTWNTHKQKTYNIPYREKMRPTYSAETLYKLKEMAKKRIQIEKTGVVWSKKQFYNLFDKYKL